MTSKSVIYFFQIWNLRPQLHPDIHISANFHYNTFFHAIDNDLSVKAVNVHIAQPYMMCSKQYVLHSKYFIPVVFQDIQYIVE